jgi:hypothetical protein
MTEVLSHWPVVVELPLQDGDRDAAGFLVDEGIARLLAAGCAAYAAGGTRLDLAAATVDDVVLRRGAVPVPDGVVAVGVAVAEVFPDRCTVEIRIRPAEGPGVAGAATCSVRPPGGVHDVLRAELIERAQGARHLH